MELISKENAVTLIKAEMEKIRTHSLVDGTARLNLRLAKNIIGDMPSIDLIRCKECKYWKYGKDICTLHDMGMMADDYCSFGDRKEKEITTDCSWR